MDCLPISLRRAGCSVLVAVVWLSAATAATHFRVSALNGADQYFAVTLRLADLVQPKVELHMPVWTPGYYQIMDYARGVSDFSATDGAGRELKWSHDDLETWSVETGGAGTIEVTYSVRAVRQFCAESYLDETYGYACSAGVFLYEDGRLDQPVEVELDLPAEWTAATGLAAVDGKPHAFHAANYDELYDCPILMGPLEQIEFTVRGVPHAFVATELGDFDRDEFIGDITRMIEAAVAIVDDIPYERYQFLAIGPGPGGIEHANTCAVGYSPANGRSPTRSRRTLNFLTHEYFHLFNAKRIRPIELGPFDYRRPNRTRMLWVAEGFTVYYEHLILKRAGLTDRDDVLGALAGAIGSNESRPGRLVQSAADASWNTWKDGPFGGDEKTTVNCYTKGTVLGLLLDLAIRHETHNERSLDDVMRLLYREYHQKQNRGYTEAEFRAACEEVAGAPLTEILDYASTNAEIDYAKYLGYAGLALELPPAVDETRITPLPNATPAQQAILDAWLGDSPKSLQ
jgi:predicted metalloprotease with PDZ domain